MKNNPYSYTELLPHSVMQWKVSGSMASGTRFHRKNLKEVQPSIASPGDSPSKGLGASVITGEGLGEILIGSLACTEMRLSAIIVGVSLMSLLGSCLGQQCTRDPPDSTDCSAANGDCNVLYDDEGPTQLPSPGAK